MTSVDSSFPIEYVTGPVQLPPWDASVTLVEVWISVLNVGEQPAATRALGYRSASAPSSPSPQDGTVPSVQLFDDGAAEVAPNAQRLASWVAWDTGSDEVGQFWVKILTSSPNLVPSVEFVEFRPQDDPGPGDVMCRYLPNDFAVFNHRVRVVVPVPTGPLLTE